MTPDCSEMAGPNSDVRLLRPGNGHRRLKSRLGQLLRSAAWPSRRGGWQQPEPDSEANFLKCKSGPEWLRRGRVWARPR